MTAETSTHVTYRCTSNVPGVFTPAQPATFVKTATARTVPIYFMKSGAGNCKAQTSLQIPAKPPLTCEQLNPPRYTIQEPKVDAQGRVFGSVTFFNKGGEASLYCEGYRPEGKALVCRYPYVHCGESEKVNLKYQVKPGAKCWIEVTQ
jgi:hypothetical protein